MMKEKNIRCNLVTPRIDGEAEILYNNNATNEFPTRAKKVPHNDVHLRNT